MIRIPHKELEDAVDALMACAAVAKDLQGHRVVFELDQWAARRAVTAALTILYGGAGPVTPEHEYYYSSMDAEPWPPKVRA